MGLSPSDRFLAPSSSPNQLKRMSTMSYEPDNIQFRLLRSIVLSTPLRLALFLVQIAMAMCALLAICVSWAVVYDVEVAIPLPAPINEWDAWQCAQSLAASSEFSSTILLTITHRVGDERIRDISNMKLREIARNFTVLNALANGLSLQELRLTPPSTANGDLVDEYRRHLSPLVFHLHDVNDDYRFVVDILGRMRHANAKLATTKFPMHVADVDANVSLSLALPPPGQPIHRLKLHVHHIAASVERTSKKLRAILSLCNWVVFPFMDDIEPISVDDQEEVELERIEKELGVMESLRQSAMIASERRRSPEELLNQITDEFERGTLLAPSAYQRPSGVLKVPRDISSLLDQQLSLGVQRWGKIWKGLFFTFCFNRQLQMRLRQIIIDLSTRWLQSLRLGIIIDAVDFGMDSADDAPDVTMMDVQPEDPFTYAVEASFNLPKFRLAGVVEGFASTSSLALEISDVRLAFNATISSLPAVFSQRSYITISLSNPAIIDLTCRLDPDETHVLGLRLPETILGYRLRERAARFIGEYPLKSFLIKWAAGLLQMVTAPRKVHVPWFDDPSDFIFSYTDAQHLFIKLQRILSTGYF